MKHRHRLAALTCVGFFVSAAASAQATYRLEHLGDLGNVGSEMPLNDAGQVAGTSGLHAFLWTNGTLLDLGTLGGTVSLGMALNNSGYVTGLSDTGSTGSQHAFLWNGSTMVDLGTLGGTNSNGQAINDAGQVAGLAGTAGNAGTHAAMWDNGTVLDLGTLGGRDSHATAINGHGHVTGRSNLSGDTHFHAFLWDGTTMTDLGTLPGHRESEGTAINDAGQVLGWSDPSLLVSGHAFLWDNGSMIALTLGGSVSNGYALNEAGQVTGQANTTDDAASHAFLWDGDEMLDLGTLGGAASSGEALNEAGQVTGSAETTGSVFHAFLWEEGVLHDLNELVDSTDPLAAYVTLTNGTAINESGQILAEGNDSRTTGQRWYLATPIVPAYDFTGFLPPVDNPPTQNVVRAGLAVPVKFSLSGDQGLDIFAPGSPSSQPMACDNGTPADPVTETVAAGGSSLSYDASSDQYTYVWQTQKAWSGTCRRLIVRLSDFTSHVANFRFR